MLLMEPSLRWCGQPERLGDVVRDELLEGTGRRFIDAHLSAAAREECVVWLEFANVRLRRALLSAWWLDKRNAATMESLVAPGLPWPLR